MQPVPLSQRDPRWSGLTLGESSHTIGFQGCTITCIAMFYGLTPDLVNDLLKKADAYYPENENDPFNPQKDLVWWTKLGQAIPGAKFVYKYNQYNNDTVLQNIPCLVEVNAASIGASRHWVLYIGNHQLIDPWDGKIKPTSTYDALSFVVLGGQYLRAPVSDTERFYKGIDVTNVESLHAAIDAWYDVARGDIYVRKLEVEEPLRHYREMQALGYTTIDDVTKVITDKDASILALQKEIAEVRDSNRQLAETVGGIEKQDSESVRLAQQALEQNRVLNDTLIQLARITETPDAKPESIVRRVFSLKSVADRMMKQKQEELMEKARVKADNLKPGGSLSGISYLLQLFNLVPMKGGAQNG